MKNRTREEIINNMCLTWDHSYFLPEPYSVMGVTIGLTNEEKQLLWDRMAQIFDNDIAPNMEFKQGDRHDD